MTVSFARRKLSGWQPWKPWPEGLTRAELEKQMADECVPPCGQFLRDKYETEIGPLGLMVRFHVVDEMDGRW